MEKIIMKQEPVVQNKRIYSDVIFVYDAMFIDYYILL